MKAAALKELLIDKMPTANDFGNEVIPGAKDAGYKVQAYAFQGYWEDIGTIEAFYRANLALVDPDEPNFSFYDREAPIYTMSRFLPPSKIVDAEIHNCIIGDGSLIKAGSTVTRSVVGLRSLINEDCVVSDTMLMGSDYYETLDECEFVPGCLPMGVGAVSHFVLPIFFAPACRRTKKKELATGQLTRPNSLTPTTTINPQTPTNQPQNKTGLHRARRHHRQERAHRPPLHHRQQGKGAGGQPRGGRVRDPRRDHRHLQGRQHPRRHDHLRTRAKKRGRAPRGGALALAARALAPVPPLLFS
jgi:carbonic anhydrase/acetyltransferase-like protein (isoleucine patch superfamily)